MRKSLKIILATTALVLIGLPIFMILADPPPNKTAKGLTKTGHISIEMPKNVQDSISIQDSLIRANPFQNRPINNFE